MSENFKNEKNERRKWFQLEGHGLELAEKLEQLILQEKRIPKELAEQLAEELKLFKAAYVDIDPNEAIPICPALHRSQQIEPDHVYMFCPVDFDDGSYVTPKSGTEITAPETLEKLDMFFAGGADMIFQHQSSFPRMPIALDDNDPEGYTM